MNIVERLRQERFWLLEKGTKDELRLVKSAGGRAITIRLLRNKRGKYHVVFPSYLFTSSISHWAPVEEEHRNCRNKNILKSLVRTLKRSLIWEYVENQDFITVNHYNKKSSKKEVGKELDMLLVSK